MTITDMQTRTALANLGCLIDNQRLDKKAFASLLAQQLETAHIAADMADVATAEITAGQLITDVSGVTDDELVEQAKPLLAATGTGPVQTALSNGYVLCSGRTSVSVVIAGQSRLISMATRFLTSDPDVIKEYVFKRADNRAEAFVQAQLELGQVIKDRIPAMTADVTTHHTHLAGTWQRALGTGTATP
jgi:hypothetical protein